MADGMTFEEFCMKYPIRRREDNKSFSNEYSCELIVSEEVSFSVERLLTPEAKRYMLKNIVGRFLSELEKHIKKAREDFERVE